MPQTKTKIQKIVSEYRSVWGRLARSTQTRDNETWHRILGLERQEIIEASDEDVMALNKIIDKLKDRMRFRQEKFALSSDFRYYVTRMSHYLKDARRLNIDPQFIFDHMTEQDKFSCSMSLADFCNGPKDWRLSPYLMEKLLCEEGNLAKLELFYRSTEKERGHSGVSAYTAVDILCTETDDDQSLEKLVERCMIYDKKKYEEASRSRNWNEDVERQVFGCIRNWNELKKLPYKTEKQRKRVLSLAQGYAFELVSRFSEDRMFFEERLPYTGDLAPLKDELLADYEQYLMDFLKTKPDEFERPTNALRYLVADSPTKIPGTIAYKLFTEHPELLDDFSGYIGDMVYEGRLAFLSPYLGGHVTHSHEDMEKAFNMLIVDKGDTDSYAERILDYYDSHRKQDDAYMTLLQFMFNDQECTKALCNQQFLGYRLLTTYLERHPDQSEDILKLSEKFEKAQLDYWHQYMDTELSTEFYAYALMLVSPDDPNKKVIEEKLLSLGEKNVNIFPYIPTYKVVPDRAISAVRWLVDQKITTRQYAFGFFHGQKSLVDERVEVCRYAVELLNNMGTDEIDNFTYEKCMDTIDFYLSNFEPSTDPDDLLSIQSLMNCISLAQKPLWHLAKSSGYQEVLIDANTKAYAKILKTAHKLQDKNPELDALIQKNVIDIKAKDNLDFNVLWPIIKNDIPVDKRLDYMKSILNSEPKVILTMLPDIVAWDNPKEGLDKEGIRKLFRTALGLSQSDSSGVLKSMVDQIPWEKYYTAEEAISQFDDRLNILINGAVLSHFPKDDDLKRKVLDHLNSMLGKPGTDSVELGYRDAKPIEEPDLLVLCPVVKELTIGKICSQEDLEKLSPYIRAAYKMMRYDPSVICYLDGHYSSEGILAKSDMYYKVFSNIVKHDKQRLMESGEYSGPEQINKHHIAEVADRVFGIMGKDYVSFCDTVAKFGDVVEYCDIFPNNWPEWTDADKGALKQFLSTNMVYAAAGKKHLRDAYELKQICAAWLKMNDDDRSGRFSDVLKSARVKVYSGVKSKDFALEALACSVKAEAYKKVQDLFFASQDVPEPFNIKERFVVEDEEGSKLVGHFLPRTDPRALSFGCHTGCCQRYNGVGEECAISSMMDPFSQVFAIENSSGDLVAGSWVWRTAEDQNFGVCFDNVEAKGGYANSHLLNKIYEQAAKYLCSQGAKTITVGVGCNDMDLSRYEEVAGCDSTDQFLKPAGYTQGGYSDAKSRQCIIAVADKEPDLPDARVPFFVRSGVFGADHHDHDGEKSSQFTERGNFDIPKDVFLYSLSSDQASVLVDKNGIFQGLSFIHPKTKQAGFMVDPAFVQQHPKALLRLWRAFQKQVAGCPDVKSWVIKVSDSNKPIFEALKKKGKVGFERIGDTGMTSIKVPPPKNMDEHLAENTKTEGRTTPKWRSADATDRDV